MLKSIESCVLELRRHSLRLSTLLLRTVPIIMTLCIGYLQLTPAPLCLQPRWQRRPIHSSIEPKLFITISQSLSFVCYHILSHSHLSLLSRGKVDALSFLDYLSPFCFLLIEFHCAFSVSFKTTTIFCLLLLLLLL